MSDEVLKKADAVIERLEHLLKGGKGPKGMYNTIANINRKKDRLGEEVTGAGPNVAVHPIAPAYESGKEQAARMARADRKKNKKQPVKIFTPEEIAEENKKLQTNVKKSWANHPDFPAANPQLLEKDLATGEKEMAERLAKMMAGKGLFGQQPPPQPTDHEMFGHLVASEEDLAKQEAKWGNTINNWLAEASKPFSSRFKSEEEEAAFWASIKISDGGNDPDSH